ncbi:hypothetical protein BRARA_A01228 [Brassica rapa]|uniref:Uncharacterized protein n=2 Tax=Brassica TaxID=3705 RepID=A0A398AKX9_BRACM|nr:hypothetical protein BRARA_A01228 [Brassica rapa]CAF2149106.1 unnamed protein product [Brassica napus]CAG7887262.1 unnamed protein product [Brassica rapa]
MRSATVFMVSCILMFFVLIHVKDVEAGLTPMGSLCGQKDIFIGRCGRDGSETCINDFVKKGGDGNRPYSCKCDNFGKKRICRCKVPC